jgi:hypothetical protein
MLPDVPGDIGCIHMVYRCVRSQVVIILCDGSAVLFMSYLLSFVFGARDEFWYLVCGYLSVCHNFAVFDCWDVFRFELYAAGVVAWFPILLGCCANVEVVGMCVVNVLLSVIQLSVGIFILG